MKKQFHVFREKAGFYDLAMTTMIAFLALLLLIRVSFTLFTSEVDLLTRVLAMTVGLALLFMLIFTLRSWKQVKIGPKGVRVKWKFLRTNKMKVRAEEIESWELIRESPLASWSGWNVHYHRPNKAVLFFRGRGILLHLKDGSSMLLGISDLDAAKSACTAHLG
ncbi:MAG: hypothetical protein ACO4CH_10425 [Saprospiraceae bacterium]